jgi:hypothetical protein
LGYGYRYRRKGANLSDINCFRVEEIEVSEKLSFDWFIAKIHEAFERLPDYRKFSPNLRYSVKEAVLGDVLQEFWITKMFAADERRHAAIPKTVAMIRFWAMISSSFGTTELPFANHVHYEVFSKLWKPGNIESNRESHLSTHLKLNRNFQ